MRGASIISFVLFLQQAFRIFASSDNVAMLEVRGVEHAARFGVTTYLLVVA